MKMTCPKVITSQIINIPISHNFLSEVWSIFNENRKGIYLFYVMVIMKLLLCFSSNKYASKSVSKAAILHSIRTYKTLVTRTVKQRTV